MTGDNEKLSGGLAEFPFNEPEKIAGSFSRLKDMIVCNNYYLERMLILANDVSETSAF